MISNWNTKQYSNEGLGRLKGRNWCKKEERFQKTSNYEEKIWQTHSRDIAWKWQKFWGKVTDWGRAIIMHVREK